jgi:hypothetical protein
MHVAVDAAFEPELGSGRRQHATKLSGAENADG